MSLKMVKFGSLLPFLRLSERNHKTQCHLITLYLRESKIVIIIITIIIIMITRSYAAL